MKSILPVMRAVALCAVAAVLSASTGVGQSANDGFDPNVNGPVLAIAIQPDGKIVIGGAFSSVGDVTRSNIARLNVDGTVDMAFNPGTDVECLGCYQSVSALAIQADGRILVGGRFSVLGGMARTNIGRLNTNGSIDTSFVADADGQVLEMAVISGGKVLVAGAFYHLDGQLHTGIGRLNSNGSLDSSFNAGANETVNGLAVQPDGRILVGGDFTMLGGQARIGIGRLNADGTLDVSFNPPAISEEMDTLALQVDGKVLVGGDFTMIGNVPRAGIGRLNADGSLDDSFDPGMEGDGLHTLVVQPDGKILVGGFFTMLSGQSRTNIGRLNPDGSLDTTFHPEVNSAANVFAVQPDRSILVGGSFTMLGGTNRNRLGRIYPDGKLDSTLLTGLSLQVATALAVQPDGGIFVGGRFVTVGGQAHTNIGRLWPDGTVDPAFTISANDYVWSTALLSNGSIIIGGSFTLLAENSCIGIGRLSAAGDFDALFNPHITGASVEILGLAIQTDGRILVGGLFDGVGGFSRTNIARLNADGSLDQTFAVRADGPVRCFALQPNGEILVGGSFAALNGWPRLGIGRLKVDGSVDESFNPGGAGVGDAIYCLALQSDGRILVAGTFSALAGQPRLSIGRLNLDGSIDPDFNPGASFSSASRGTVRSLVVQTDGRILVGGAFTELGGHARAFLGRLNSGGSLDSTFNPGANAQVYAFALQPDGKVLVGGQFNLIAGQSRDRLARLTTGGTAAQSIAVSPAGASVTWFRSGTGPEVEDVTLEVSTDRTNYALLGRASRIFGGWRLDGLELPKGRIGLIRARGRAIGGFFRSSSYVVESVAQFYLIPPAHITSVGTTGDGAFQFAFTNTTGASYTVLATTNVAEPAASWEVLGAPTPVGNGLYQFTDPGATNHARRFYQLRSP